ncbi:MAG: SGNH/GDSL hydrolase family protein [Propionibacteriaceae bacterium]|nr:SGNH/GDSL hydrolase family protein [Propionibacteriaceae bacterium]
MNRFTKALLTSAAALTLIFTAAVPASAGPLTPNRGRFAAVGDSYAAGVGNTPLKHAGTTGRSADAYPVLLAGRDNKVTFLAESGATTKSVMTNQVQGVLPTTQQITVTVGGNDIGFAKVALACASPTEACSVALNNALAALSALPDDLGALLMQLQMRAPEAEIYVTGYPLLFQPKNNACPALPGYDATTLGAADAGIGLLNGVIANTATALEVEYVDVTGEFAGHGLCDGMNSFIFPPSFFPDGYPNPSSLHPSAAGQAAYAKAIEETAFHSAAEG